MFLFKPLSLGVGTFLASLATGFASPSDGKIHLSYWEKWSGAEENAMQQVVGQFNRSQDRIVVDFLSVGEVEQKTILATAGGDPPDISGIYLENICSFADRNALTPLDGFIRDDGSTPDQFLSRYAKAYTGMGSYHGKVWGVPSTPTTSALFWNKELFRSAGLDPDRPPRTLAELEAMSAKLTLRDASGNLKQVGFLPQASGGWIWAFPQWFGGELFDGRNVTIGADPANLKAYRWLGDFSKQYGLKNVRRLTSSFGSLASPEDPFMSGRVAMMFDGVWRNHFIRQFAPGMSYGVAGWPEARPGIGDFTVADADMLVIPRGALHPREAWTFLRYVSSPNLSAQRLEDLRGVELLCYLQEKVSPLAQWSPYFEAHNPNPDIGIFRRLAESPHAIHVPEMGVWEEYQRELNIAFDEVRLGLESPEEALQHCQVRIQNSWIWHCESLARRKREAPPGPPGGAPASSNPPSPSPP
jgi:ABC-type glycerol-3-phosphate transport system substrate-binding protein